MARQYVHLATTPEVARLVGRRKDSHPVILLVRAGQAWEAGVLFYRGNEVTWLADAVPPQFLEGI